MKKRILSIALVLPIILYTALLSGCATQQAIVHPGPTGEISKPAKGKAAVVFVRSGWWGKGLNTRIYDGDKLVGVLQGKTYFVYAATPGKHLFNALATESVSHSNMSFVNANLRSGKTYYIGVHFHGRPFTEVTFLTELEPIKRTDPKWKGAKAWVREFSRIEMTDGALKTEKEIDSEVRTSRDKYYKEALKKGSIPKLGLNDGE